MGLTVVEIVMEIEETFAIRISDEEAERVFTVGDARDLVWSKIAHRHGDGPACQSGHCFYRLRRALGSVLGLPRDRVKPSTPLDGLLPAGDELRVAWTRLAAATALRLPPLESKYARLLPPRRTWTLQRSCRSVAVLVRAMVDSSLDVLPRRLGRWSREGCLNEIRRITADVLRIDPSLVTPEKHFVRDLGAD